MKHKLFIPNKQQQRLATVIHRPKGGKQAPAVILLAGFTGYKEESHLESLAQELCHNGMVAVRFDASGFGESEGSLENDYRFSNYLNDVNSVFNFLRSQPQVDPKRIGVWGHSLGGMLAIIFAAQHPQIKAVVTVSSPCQLGTGDMLEEMLSRWKHKGYLERESSKFGRIQVPYAFFEDACHWNVLDHVTRLKVPLLVVWGTADTNVPPSETRKIFEAATEPKKSLEIPGMDHYYKNAPKLLGYINERTTSFFKDWLLS